MCVASKYLSELDSLNKRISGDHKRLAKKISEYDKLISEHYHKIEVTKFNACEGYYLSKQLQELLRKRRILKDEWGRVNGLKLALEQAKLDRTIGRVKENVNKAKKKSYEWQKDWESTYDLEEILH